ncbi:acyltransferase [Pseudomonas sp. B21-015]|uniref:acyltransferase family protein n=1 Tax=Pseudomonas sp. B21-015 TaxID=2895473 RepID=UPI00215F70A6|nr:acyltransferase [Pseudomonas sp. B21-015]UVM48520.1 acyltransferase [Pseudomonas sp. B21-015]
MANKQGFYVELESIRGLMAWWVVFGHLYSCFRQAIGNVPPIINEVLLATAIPVDIFICLSGFFIAKALNGKSSDYKPYIVRRAFRIIPIYLLAMFLAALLFNERMSVRMEMPWNTPGQLAAVENYWSTISDNVAAYLMPCLMLLQGLIPDQVLPHAGDAFLAPAWSLTLEWQFYLIAPLLVWGFLLKRGKELLVASSLIALLLLTHSGLTFSYGSFILIKLPVFIIGMLTHDLIRRGEDELKNGLLIIVIVLGIGLISRSFANFASITLWSVLAIAFKLNGRFRQPLITRMLELSKAPLRNKMLVKLGVLSYSTYLIHILIIDAVMIVARAFGYLSSDLVALFIALSIVFTYAASSVIHRYIETPFIDIGKRIATSVYSRELKCQ